MNHEIAALYAKLIGAYRDKEAEYRRLFDELKGLEGLVRSSGGTGEPGGAQKLLQFLNAKRKVQHFYAWLELMREQINQAVARLNRADQELLDQATGRGPSQSLSPGDSVEWSPGDQSVEGLLPRSPSPGYSEEGELPLPGP